MIFLFEKKKTAEIMTYLNTGIFSSVVRLLPREVLDGLRESAARLPPRPPLADLLAGGETAAVLAFFA